MADLSPEWEAGGVDSTTFRELLDAIDAGVAHCELKRGDQGNLVDIRFVVLNRVLASILDIDPGEATGSTLRALIPDVPELWIERCQQAVDSRERVQFRDCHHASGRWFDVQLLPLAGEAFVVLVTNSTELHEADEALRQSKEKYDRLVNSIDVGFAILEIITDDAEEPVDYRMLEVNPHFERLTGIPAEEALSGKTIREIVPDLEPKWWQIYGRVGLTGESHRFVEGSDALGRWFDVYAFQIEAPQKRHVAILYNDITRQKQAEREREWLLREVEAERRLLSDVFEHAPSYMTILRGPEHIVERANEAYRQLTADRELIGRRLCDAIPEIVEQGFIDLLDHVYRTGETHIAKNAIARLRRSHESDELEERVLDYVFQPIRDPSGEIAGIFVQGTDLTERVRAEASQRRREEQQRFLLKLGDVLQQLEDAGAIELEAARLLGTYLQASRVAFLLIRPDGTISVGPEYTRDVPSLRGPMNFNAYDDSAADDLVAGRVVVSSDAIENPHLTDEQRAMFMWAQIRAHISVPIIRQGRLVGLLAVHDSRPRPWTNHDVELVRETGDRVWSTVERASAERDLRESERLFRTVIDTIDEGFILSEAIFDDDGTCTDMLFLDANPAAIELVGLDMVGFRTSEITQEFEPYWYEVWGNVARTGEPRREELYATPLQSWLNIYVAKLEPEDPSSNIVMAIFQDVTRRREQEETTRRARLEAEEGVRARDEFLSIASHELRNPLASIKVSSQLLHRLSGREQIDDQQLRRLARSLVDSSDRMAALVDDLLDVSRLRAGQLRLERQPTDLSALLIETIDELQTSVDLSGLSLTVDIRPTVDIDAERIRQVVVNLLDNASKYSPEGNEIVVSLTPANDGVCLSVRDDGIGLPTDALESVFEPFGRAENATQSNIPGMGLGLYICRRIAVAHHGRLWAESDGPGHGTTFWLWLPLEESTNGDEA